MPLDYRSSLMTHYFGFDWTAARRIIECETHSFQQKAAVISMLIGALFPIAFLIDDIVHGRSPAYLNYGVPFALLLGTAAFFNGRRFSRLTQATVIVFLVSGFFCSVTLPFARDVQILIFFTFPSIAFLILGNKWGLAASVVFSLMATSFWLLAKNGILSTSIYFFKPSILAMASTSFALQCVVMTVSESRHAKNVSLLVERRFFDAETRQPNASAFAMERLSPGETIVLVHIANMRELGTLTERDAGNNLATRAALLLRERGFFLSSRRGPFRLSETDFCLIIPSGADAIAEVVELHSSFAETAAIRNTPLRFIAKIVSYRSLGARSAGEALDAASAALSDCIATEATSLHKDDSDGSEDRTILKNQAPVLLRNIERSLFKPVFQPVYDLALDGIGFFEALIRLDDSGSAVSPERYLGTAFRLGLDKHLTEFILDATLSLALDSGHSVSFNATFRDILRPSFRGSLAKAYASLAGRENTIIVEITEQTPIEDVSIFIEFVSEVHARGGLVFLDDFGSGYSNYASLLASRFDAVKAAGELVRDIAIRPDAYTLYRGMAAFCAEAGISVVAEHVSGSDIMELAVLGGARYLQGYLFSQPLSAKEILNASFSFPEGLSTKRTPLSGKTLSELARR